MQQKPLAQAHPPREAKESLIRSRGSASYHLNLFYKLSAFLNTNYTVLNSIELRGKPLQFAQPGLPFCDCQANLLKNDCKFGEFAFFRMCCDTQLGEN